MYTEQNSNKGLKVAISVLLLFFVIAGTNFFGNFQNKEVCIITMWEPLKSKLLALEGTVELNSSRNTDKDKVDLQINKAILDENNPKFAYLETIIDEYFDVLHKLKDDYKSSIWNN